MTELDVLKSSETLIFLSMPRTPPAKTNEQAVMNAASLGGFKNAICLHEKKVFLHFPFYNESVKRIFNHYPFDIEWPL